MNNPLAGQFKLNHYFYATLLLFMGSLSSPSLHAQVSAKPEPDVVIFANGEKLIGHFEKFTGGAAKFKSDTLGEITVDLSKVQEFHTAQKFAVIRKNLKLPKNKVDGQIPQGTISVANQNVEINPSNGQPVQTIAVGDVSNIIDQASFEQAFRRPGIFEHWNGAIAVGASIVEATQNSLSFDTSVGLVRTIPSEDWLQPRNRTTIDFNDSYGKVTQPNTPTVKTSIYHADAERDEYVASRFYLLGSVAFDHNFSQGLDLQQTYGGGAGWTIIQDPNQTLDFKGSVDYQRQAFEIPTQDQNLADSIFMESYNLKFAHGTMLKEQLSASPAWTNTRAYSAYARLGLYCPYTNGLGSTQI